jgi:hypothetical protein
MEERYGIKNRHDANLSYIVFDTKARYVKVYRRKTDFEYNEDLEKLLRREKLYAHNAGSFYCRHREFYDLMLIEQLKLFEWTFDESGNVTGANW